jgi:hypothetical protein
LLGCHYPVILRGYGEKMYRLVGECHSPHLKQGETMQWLDSGECQIETVTICQPIHRTRLTMNFYLNEGWMIFS